MSRKLLSVMILLLIGWAVDLADAQDGVVRFTVDSRPEIGSFVEGGSGGIPEGFFRPAPSGDGTTEHFFSPIPKTKPFTALVFKVEIDGAAVGQSQGGGGVFNEGGGLWNFQNPWPLEVTIVPAVAGGSVLWTVADFELRDDTGAVIDDPPSIIAILIAQLRDAWRNAFASELLAIVRATYPDGLPGPPRFGGISLDLQGDNLLVDIEFADGFQVLETLMRTSKDDAGKGEAETHTIYEEQMNAALQAFGGNGQDILFVDSELTNAGYTAYLALLGDGSVRFLKLVYRANLAFNGSDSFTYKFFGPEGSTEHLYVVDQRSFTKAIDTAGANPLTQDVRGMDFDMPAPVNFPPVAVQWMSRVANRFLATQIGFGRVQDVFVRDGAIEITATPRTK